MKAKHFRLITIQQRFAENQKIENIVHANFLKNSKDLNEHYKQKQLVKHMC